MKDKMKRYTKREFQKLARKKLTPDHIKAMIGYVKYEIENPEDHLPLVIVSTLLHDVQGILLEDSDSGFIPKSHGYIKYAKEYGRYF